jgi:hypothetical protein
LDDKKREEIDQRMCRGNRDPKGAIGHDDILVFLEKCLTYDLSKDYVETFKTARQLWEFMIYGLNIRADGNDSVTDSRSFSFAKTDRIAVRLDQLFEIVVTWCSINGVDSGSWVPIAMDQSRKFIEKRGFYSNWTKATNLAYAEHLRTYLQEGLRNAKTYRV